MAKQLSIFCMALILTLTLAPSQSALAEGGGIVTDDPESLGGANTTRPYSPYAQRNFPNRPLWGDTHLHTAVSFDAGALVPRYFHRMPIVLPKVKK